MVTRGTARILTGMTAPKSCEDSKLGGSSCLSHNAHSELESKSTGQESPTARSQTAFTGRASVYHKPEKLLFGPELESTSHWDPPSVTHKQLSPSGGWDREP
ncbi:unnamed protein product [Pipistrellus nathusii]|uniref:Uncharacterized protein n=1 Tax=Pipistrellus nathusii TaxID=59473 RepID=A0ABP0AEM8_PIPNA